MTHPVHPQAPMVVDDVDERRPVGMADLFDDMSLVQMGETDVRPFGCRPDVGYRIERVYSDPLEVLPARPRADPNLMPLRQPEEHPVGHPLRARIVAGRVAVEDVGDPHFQIGYPAADALATS